MIQVNPNFVTDAEGQRVGVLLTMAEYKRLMDEAEELEDIRLCEEARRDIAEHGTVSFEEVRKEIGLDHPTS